MKTKKIWTKEECRELAKQCQNKSEFARRFKMATIASRENGWMDEFFGANRGDACTRHTATATCKIRRPDFDTWTERNAWQNKVAMRLQREIRRAFNPGKPYIVVVEPCATKQSLQKFEAEVTIINITREEIAAFQETAKKVFEDFNPGTEFA